MFKCNTVLKRCLAFIFVLVMSGVNYADELEPQALLHIGLSSEHEEFFSSGPNRFGGAYGRGYACIFERVGEPYVIDVVPHKRTLHHLEHNLVSVGIGMVQRPSRDEYAYFAKPVFKADFNAYSSKSFNFDEDVSHLSLVTLRGSYGVAVAEALNIQVNEVSSWEVGLKLVERGRFDMAVLPALVFSGLDPEFTKGFIATPLSNVEVSLYVSKKYRHAKQLLKKINTAIDVCTAEHSSAK